MVPVFADWGWGRAEEQQRESDVESNRLSAENL